MDSLNHAFVARHLLLKQLAQVWISFGRSAGASTAAMRPVVDDC